MKIIGKPYARFDEGGQASVTTVRLLRHHQTDRFNLRVRDACFLHYLQFDPVIFAENVLPSEINEKLGSRSYFCEPYHSWEKGSVEQVNGLIRRFFPKGTDFTDVPASEINRVEKLLNNRPRKCLNYQTSYETFRKACGALAD